MNTRPTLTPTITALRTVLTNPRFAHVQPTDEEADVAAVLEEIEAGHQGSADEPAADGWWGSCTACGDLWPCERFVWAEQLAVQFLGRAADRYAARAQDAMDASRRTA